MSFARRYAEHGDYEVSGGALDSIVVINRAYIEAKGRTFFAGSPFFNDPRSPDAFITNTLEHVRLNVQAAIARRDEQQLRQGLEALAQLSALYQRIDYSSSYAEKTHAHLAAAYLASGVEAVVAHDMPDVLFEGVRLMGQSALQFISPGSPIEIVTLIQKISLIGSATCVEERRRHVTREAVAQLAGLTFNIVCSKGSDFRFALKEIRDNVAQVSALVLSVPDPWPSSIHSNVLEPYYSLNFTDSLRLRLGMLANELCKQDAENEDAQAIVQNIEIWADGLGNTTKDLLLTAVSARSSFTSSLVQWITGVTEILLAVSNAPACGRHTQEELRRHACRLMAAFTWIPADEETVKFVEASRLTEAFFGTAQMARENGCEDVALEIEKHLLSWTFKGGKYVTGWGVLQHGLCACAALALMGGSDNADELKINIRACLQDDRGPKPEALEYAIRAIRTKAASLPERGHTGSKIDLGISRLDHRTLAPLLDEIASMLEAGAQ